MSQGLLLDASVFLAAELGRMDLRKRLSAVPDARVALSVISLAGLGRACATARSPEQRVLRGRFVGWLADHIPILPFDGDALRVHAELVGSLASAMGADDLMIAATALATNHRLVTATPRDFARVPDLALAIWDA